MAGQQKLFSLFQCFFGMLFDDGKQSLLCGSSFGIDQIHDDALRLANNGGVRLADKVADRCRMPVITTSHPAGIVHALLHHRPFATLAENECMQIQLESVGNGVVIYSRCESARAHQSVAVQARSVCHGS